MRLRRLVRAVRHGVTEPPCAQPQIAGDDWAERVGTEIARRLDVPVDTTELAERVGLFGTVSLSVLDPEFERLVHENEPRRRSTPLPRSSGLAEVVSPGALDGP